MSAAARMVSGQHPRFKQAVLADLRCFLAFRFEGDRRLVTRRDAVRELVRMLWVSDAFFALACYRAKARLQALRVPLLPALLHRLAMSSAQVCIGDPVVVEPGVYVAHGQIVIDGFVRVGSGAVLLPWVTIGLVEGELRGPTLGSNVFVGTGAKVLGPITVGAGAHVGANAVVLVDVPDGATAVGVPARVVSDAAGPLETHDDPLAAAELLVGKGDWRRAIETLAEHHRREPSGVVAHRLVQLRNECFLAEEHPAPDLAWPPPDPGVFADVQGVPEVSASDLDVAALRSGLFGHGSLIVRGLLDASQVERLARAVRCAFEAYDSIQAGSPVPDAEAWYRPFEPAPGLEDERGWIRGGGGVLAADSPRALAELIEVLAESPVLATIEEHFGERPALSVRKTTLRDVPPDTTTEWHQDGAFLGAGLRTVNVWLALTPCGVDAPSIDVVARRLAGIVEPGGDGSVFSWSVSDESARRAAGDAGIVRPVFEAGDAILFDDLNLHRTGAGPGLTKHRLAIEAWCFASSAYPLAQLPIAL